MISWQSYSTVKTTWMIVSIIIGCTIRPVTAIACKTAGYNFKTRAFDETSKLRNFISLHSNGITANVCAPHNLGQFVKTMVELYIHARILQIKATGGFPYKPRIAYLT